MKKCKALIIGPHFDTRGGISRVSKIYKDYGLFDENTEYIPSYCNGNILNHLITYVFCLIKYTVYLLTNNNLKLIHVTSASRGSFLRKSIIINIAKLFGKKTIIHIRGAEFNVFYQESPFLIQKYITHTLNKSDLILVLSKQWQLDIEAKCRNKNIKILYNPTLPKERASNQETENINVLFMGRIGKRKGAYEIIEAAKSLRNSKIKINLYGDGQITEFEKLINDNHLQDVVKINGWITGNKVDQAYKKANIYILPSFNEGLPNSVLEAISYGLPVISTPVGGIPEIIKDGHNGFLIEPGDHKALLEKIKILSFDKDLRTQMGEKSYQISKEKFDINIILSDIRHYHKELIDENLYQMGEIS